MTKRFAFPKSVRVRKRRDFVRIQDTGAKLTAGPLLALWTRNTLSETRLGLTVSSKVGNAVVRARIRRHLREWFRHHRADVPGGIDLVLVARPSAKDLEGAALGRAFADLSKKLRAVVK